MQKSADTEDTIEMFFEIKRNKARSALSLARLGRRHKLLSLLETSCSAIRKSCSTIHLKNRFFLSKT